MYRHYYLTALLVIVVACIFIGCGKPYVITTAEDRPFAMTTNVKMGEFLSEFPEGADPGKMPTKEDVDRFKHLILAELAETGLFNTLPGDKDSAAYVINGSILDYSKGSKAAQFLIGFGAGAAKVTTAIKLVDAKTGQVVFAGNFTGKVSDWTRDGNEVFIKAAKNFAKAISSHIRGYKS